jgi:hypothetical protein
MIPSAIWQSLAIIAPGGDISPPSTRTHFAHEAFRVRYPPVSCIYENVRPVVSRSREVEGNSQAVHGPAKAGELSAPRALREQDQSLDQMYHHPRTPPMKRLPYHVRTPTPEEEHSFVGRDSLGPRDQLRRQRRIQNSTDEESEASDYVRLLFEPYTIPRRGASNAYGCPEAFDGYLPLRIQPLPPIPIPDSGRNAELFHFCKYN